MQLLKMSLLTLLAAVLLTLAVTGCGRGAASVDGRGSNGKINVVATIFAYYDIVRAVGGDQVNPAILLQPNQSPHEFQASPQDKDRVLAAKVIVKNGLGIDDWVDKLAQGSKGEIIDIGKNAEVLKTKEVEWDTPDTAATKPPEHDHAAGNPHIWLDPVVQRKATEVIRDALIKADPANKAAFEANAAKYLAQLDALDRDFRNATKTFKYHDFIGFHSAYDYLAHRYGLRQVAALAEVEGPLSPGQVQKVIDLIKTQHVPVLFMEDAFPQQSADLIVKETGVKTGILQPLETYPNLDATYNSLMRQNLKELQRTLQ